MEDCDQVMDRALEAGPTVSEGGRRCDGSYYCPNDAVTTMVGPDGVVAVCAACGEAITGVPAAEILAALK